MNGCMIFNSLLKTLGMARLIFFIGYSGNFPYQDYKRISLKYQVLSINLINDYLCKNILISYPFLEFFSKFVVSEMIYIGRSCI